MKTTVPSRIRVHPAAVLALLLPAFLARCINNPEPPSGMIPVLDDPGLTERQALVAAILLCDLGALTLVRKRGRSVA